MELHKICVYEVRIRRKKAFQWVKFVVASVSYPARVQFSKFLHGKRVSHFWSSAFYELAVHLLNQFTCLFIRFDSSVSKPSMDRSIISLARVLGSYSVIMDSSMLWKNAKKYTLHFSGYSLRLWNKELSWYTCPVLFLLCILLCMPQEISPLDTQ